MARVPRVCVVVATVVAYTCCAQDSRAQQVPDSAFSPHVSRPTFSVGAGPVIAVDAAHHNVHTIDGQFMGFARLAAADGYRVRSMSSALSASALEDIDLLVIASPRHPETLRSRRRPIQVAYADREVAALRNWVTRGGAVLLVSDHMPVPSSMRNLFEAFGIEATDGFATTTLDRTARLPIVYRRSDGTLAANVLTNGRSAVERIDSIATFTGSVFRSSPAFETIWRLPNHTIVILPDAPWEFLAHTPQITGDGLAQGAFRVFGKGRVIVSAEAAMFTAQREGEAREPMGMNHPAAAQNSQFVLNCLRWLTANTTRASPAARAGAAARPRDDVRRTSPQ